MPLKTSATQKGHSNALATTLLLESIALNQFIFCRHRFLHILHKYHILHYNTLLLPSCNCRLSFWWFVEHCTLNRNKSHHRNFYFCKVFPLRPLNTWSFYRNWEISPDTRDLRFPRGLTSLELSDLERSRPEREFVTRFFYRLYH